jgi:hypothetical protein
VETFVILDVSQMFPCLPTLGIIVACHLKLMLHAI